MGQFLSLSEVLGENLWRDNTSEKVNLWRDNTSVLEWFKNLQEKKKMRFIVFDIVDYYPSITRELLERALAWASNLCEVGDLDKKIILEARKTFLFLNGDPHIKKTDNTLFDVPQGAWDSCEVTELCGIFLLNKISDIMPPQSVGLYRDDGLCALKKSGPQLETVVKN